MNSSRPYLIHALYDWIIDNECTPYILVNAKVPGVDVPREHIKEGRIILNLSTAAVQDLSIGNEAVDFNGRFAGVARRVYVPITAILGIYARENGQGMIFESEKIASEPSGPTEADETGSPQTKPASQSAVPRRPPGCSSCCRH